MNYNKALEKIKEKKSEIKKVTNDATIRVLADDKEAEKEKMTTLKCNLSTFQQSLATHREHFFQHYAMLLSKQTWQAWDMIIKDQTESTP